MRGSWGLNKDCNILTPTLIAISVVSFSFSWCSTGGPGGPAFCWVLACFTTSCLLTRLIFYCRLLSNCLVLNSIGGPRAPSAGWWLSLAHLVSITSHLQLSDFLSWLSYIIVQRPLNRPLSLWNGMFDRHQAEITVMQFTGHCLLVHQSLSVPWEFYLVPFCKPSPPTWFLLISAIGMCHFHPVHHFGMAYFAGLMVNM